MMVERRWPTCISFATFGDEKSTTVLPLTVRFSTPTRSVSARIDCSCAFRNSRENFRLMKPGPPISGSRNSPAVFADSPALIFSATCRGFVPGSFFVSASAALHW